MKFNLQTHILLAAILPLVAVTIIFSSISVANIETMGEKRIKAYHDMLLDQKKREVANYIDMAFKIIVDQNNREDAAKIIRNLQFGKIGYIWINDDKGFMVAHPDPKLNGTPQWDLTDASGRFIIRELLDVCQKKGEGYIAYSWKRSESSDQPAPKLSYARSVAKFGWIIATGVYTDDIDALVASEQNQTRIVVADQIGRNIIISLAVLLVVSLFIVFFIERRVNRPM